VALHELVEAFVGYFNSLGHVTSVDASGPGNIKVYKRMLGELENLPEKIKEMGCRA